MSKFSILGSIVVAFAFASSASAQTFYTDRTTFLGDTNPGYYEEGFSSFAMGNPLNGSQTTWDSPGANGFDFTASATNGLWSLPSALSTFNSGDSIVFTFTGLPVTSFGGDFAGTDIDGNSISALVTYTSNNGDVFSHTVADFAFIGLVSPVALSTVSISTTSGVATWPGADSLVVGQQVPEPTAAFGLVAGAAALLLRRRK